MQPSDSVNTEDGEVEGLPMFTRRTLMAGDLRFLGMWNEWLLLETEDLPRDMIVMDRNGRVVLRFPEKEYQVLGLVGVMNGRAIVNALVGYGDGTAVIAFDLTGEEYVLREPRYCYAVWKDRLVSFSSGAIELWEWIEATRGEARLVVVQRFHASKEPSIILGFEQRLLVYLYGKGIFERSTDGTWNGVACPNSCGWKGNTVMEIIQWKGFVISTYLDRVCQSRLCMWDTEWNVVRDIPFEGRMYAGYDSVACSDPSTSVRNTIDLWSVRSWNPTFHDRYPRKVRDAIRTWMVHSWNRNIPRDIILLVARTVADAGSTAWVQ